MKKYLLLVFILFFLLTLSSPAEAKLLPQSKSVKSKLLPAVAKSFSVSARLRADRKALFVTFSNPQKVKNIAFTLTYQTNGKEEGAGGSVPINSPSVVTRELLFGTCSSGVCRYHSNMSNMRLQVSYESLAGKRYIKRFKIRV